MVVALAMVAAYLAGAMSARTTSNPSSYPLADYNGAVILKKKSPTVYYVWLPPDPAVGRTVAGKYWATFCEDFVPPFESGMTLLTLRVENRGVCWSLRPRPTTYTISKDDSGNVILAKGD